MAPGELVPLKDPKREAWNPHKLPSPSKKKALDGIKELCSIKPPENREGLEGGGLQSFLPSPWCWEGALPTPIWNVLGSTHCPPPRGGLRSLSQPHGSHEWERFSSSQFTCSVLLNSTPFFLMKHLVEGVQLLPSLDFHVLMVLNYSRRNFYFSFSSSLLLHWMLSPGV